MIRNGGFRRDESGYSIVEVLAAITILMIAILPMFKMFDVGLKTTTTSSNYDLARSLAEKQAELAQIKSYSTVRNETEAVPGCTYLGDLSAAPYRVSTGCKDPDPVYDNLRFSITKNFVSLNGSNLKAHSSDEGLIQVTISVTRAGDANPLFTTSGVIANNG